MKTFSEFLSDHEGDDEGIMKALRIACSDHKEDTMSFLQRLAKQNPDIQIELDKMNHQNGNMPMKRRPGYGKDPERSDVIVPNTADNAAGDMPN